MKVKTVISVIFAFLLGIELGFAQWESLGDSIIPPGGYAVRSLKIAGDGSIWMISRTIFPDLPDHSPVTHRSNDGGLSWIQTYVTEASPFVGWDISPIDSLIAYIAVDSAGVFKTIDGGRSWLKVPSFQNRAVFVHFFNKDEGWVFNGLTYDVSHSTLNYSPWVHAITHDGGESWVYSDSLDWYEVIANASFVVDTTDNIGPFFSNCAYDAAENSLVIGTAWGIILLSNDRGANWEAIKTPLADLDLSTVTVGLKDSNTIMVAGGMHYPGKGRPTVSFATADRGKTWIEGAPGVNAAALRYIPGTDSTFVLSGYMSMYNSTQGTAITHDFGKSWEIIGQDRVHVLDFLDANTGAAACLNAPYWHDANGQVYKWKPPLDNASGKSVNWYLWLLMPGFIIAFIIIILIRKRNVANKKLLAQQISQLEQSAKKAQINPDFIFNSLKAIQELMNTENKQRANEYLTSFAKLTRGVLSASSETIISLEDDLALLKNYLELEKLHYWNRLNYNIEIDEKLDLYDTMLPAMVVQSIAENAIRVGLAPISSTGTINVKYRISNNLLETIIEDNFAMSAESSRQSPTVDQRLNIAGIGHIRDRLEQVQAHCEMRVERIQSTDGTITGTKTIVEIKLN